jgi:hypothetical protein
LDQKKHKKILEKTIENMSQAITKSKFEKEKCSQDWAAEGDKRKEKKRKLKLKCMIKTVLLRD